MTGDVNNNDPYSKTRPQSMSLFDGMDTGPIRVRPADLARLLNVSKQSVSQWVKNGKITIGSDGRIDPKLAVEQLLRNANPATLRAKMLRPLTDDVKKLQTKIAQLEATLQDRENLLSWLDSEYDDLHDAFSQFENLIVEHEFAIRSTPNSNEFARLIAAISEHVMKPENERSPMQIDDPVHIDSDSQATTEEIDVLMQEIEALEHDIESHNLYFHQPT